MDSIRARHPLQKIDKTNNKERDVSGQALVLSPKGTNLAQGVGEDSSESPNEPKLNAKQIRSIKKKVKQKINKNKRNTVHQIFKQYMEYLDFIWNKDDMNMNDQPSYSMLHSLPGGLSIVLYTCSHSGSSRVPICRNSAVRLILGPDMMVIWRENLLHSGAKSRNNVDSHTTRQATELSPSKSCDKETTVVRSNTRNNNLVKEDLSFFCIC